MSAELTAALSKYVREAVQQQVQEELTGVNVHETVNLHTQPIVEKYLKDNMSAELTSALGKYVKNIIDTQVTTKLVTNTVDNIIQQELAKFNVQDTVNSQTKNTVSDYLTKVEFPEKSINNTSINWEGFRINANMVTGQFTAIKSAGIEDASVEPQIKVDDSGLVVLHNLTAPVARLINTKIDNITVTKSAQFSDAEFTGDVTIKGTLHADNIAGLNEVIEGKETVNINGKAVLSESRLGNTVVDSNLRKVGVLRELQVDGESLLANSLYVSPAGRIGINTDEPTHALCLWDEEIQLIVGKQKQDVAVIGTTRTQNLHLQSNGKDNIVLTSNGETKIDKPVLNNKTFTSSDIVPGYQGQLGDICWNKNPGPGKPIGWVCIGNTQWFKFGMIE